MFRLLREGGQNFCEIARRTGRSRSTIRSALRRRAGVAQSAEAADLKSAQWGFESLHQHQRPEYAYLLGLYLGDGHISKVRQTYRLRLFLGEGQDDVVRRSIAAIAALHPSGPISVLRSRRMAIVHSHWVAWPRVIPQHGPGRKHLREIRLEPDQRRIIERHADRFLRGLIESDGCRHRRIVRGTDYPAYSFKNRSEDSLGLFSDACAHRTHAPIWESAAVERTSCPCRSHDARTLPKWMRSSGRQALTDPAAMRESSTEPYADSPPCCSRSRFAPSPTPTRG